MQELQASSGTQSGGSAQSQKETVNTKQSCHQFAERRRKELADISKKICVGLFVDLLTFELALTGLGCQFR